MHTTVETKDSLILLSMNICNNYNVDVIEDEKNQQAVTCCYAAGTYIRYKGFMN